MQTTCLWPTLNVGAPAAAAMLDTCAHVLQQSHTHCTGLLVACKEPLAYSQHSMLSQQRKTEAALKVSFAFGGGTRMHTSAPLL